MQQELEVLRETPTQLMAVWRCFVLVVVRRSPTAEDAEALVELLSQLAERGVQHAAIVHCAVVAGAGDPPGEAARERYRALMQDPNSICRGSAIVIEQEGFVGSIIRSVLTSLMFLTRAVYPTRAHGSKAAAAEWLLALLRQRGSEPATVDELVAAMEASMVRARTPAPVRASTRA